MTTTTRTTAHNSLYPVGNLDRGLLWLRRRTTGTYDLLITRGNGFLLIGRVAITACCDDYTVEGHAYQPVIEKGRVQTVRCWNEPVRAHSEANPFGSHFRHRGHDNPQACGAALDYVAYEILDNYSLAEWDAWQDHDEARAA